MRQIDMWETFKSIILSSTAKDSSILYLGNILSVAINFLITLLLTRSLTTSEFGIFVTGLIFLQLLVDLFELGINPALINLASSSKEKSVSYIRASFLLKVIIGIVVSLILIIFASPISLVFFKNNSMAPIIIFSSLGFTFLTFILWGQSVFQSQKNFVYSALLNTSINIFRLVVLTFLLLSAYFNLYSAFFVSQIVLGFSSLFVLYKLRILFKATSVEKKDVLKLLSFGIPIGASFALAAIYTKLDQLMIYNIAGEKEAGIYGLANRLALPLVYLVAAFGAAITPRFSSIENKLFISYFKKTIYVVTFISISVLVFLPIASTLVNYFFPGDFSEAIWPFQILVMGFIFFLISTPFTTAIVYRYKKNKYPLLISIISLIVVWNLLTVLIPKYKSVGASLAICLLFLMQLIFSILYIWHLVHKTNRKSV